MEAAWIALNAPSAGSEAGSEILKYGIQEAQKETKEMQTSVWKVPTKTVDPPYQHSALMEAIVVIRTHRHRDLVSAAPHATFTAQQRDTFVKAAALSHEAMRVCGCGR